MKVADVIAPLGHYRVVKWSEDGSEVAGDFEEYAAACAEADRLASTTIHAAVFSPSARKIYSGGRGPVSTAQPLAVTSLARLAEPKKRTKHRRRK